MAQVVG
jgi:hypothetical protein